MTETKTLYAISGTGQGIEGMAQGEAERLLVELLEKIPNLTSPDANPVPGFTFAEGDRMNGNSEDQVVSWGGCTDISAVGEAIGIRIRMFDAEPSGSTGRECGR